MRRLDPDKLHVTLLPGVTATAPIIGRRYTLTHSDTTGELFLSIGTGYALDKITPLRDEVLAEWVMLDSKKTLVCHVLVDGKFGLLSAAARNAIFMRELPLALEAIRYGDDPFFQAHPELDQAPLWVQFHSTIPAFNRWERWGTPEEYA